MLTMYSTIKGRGFTVIELLIIVIIVAILVSIVIPAIFAAKHKAQQIICVNNLRQLFLAFEQYTNDNNGLLPRPNNSSTSKDGTKICNAEVWFKAVDNYLTTLQLPGERGDISLEERLLLIKQDPIFKTVSLSKQDTTRTIKMNQNLLPASECQRSIETIENTTKTVLLFDGRVNTDGVANNYEGSYGSVAQRHSKAANILFIDGHVERIQNGDSDGTTNEGWPNRQAGQELIWDPENPNLP
ncbi:MAG: hypothetical protein HYV59_01250 [Planctomycetes bacterium]|nr:hypothetical protein [Planctomycetota bacterium]